MKEKYGIIQTLCQNYLGTDIAIRRQIMTNAEVRETFGKMGLSAEDTDKVLERFDAEKITEIVEGTNSPDEAFEAIHKAYPELEAGKMKEQLDFIREQMEAAAKEHKEKNPVELTEGELEKVAGGGFWGDVGAWFKKNWKAVAVGAAIVVGAALIGTGIGAAIGSTMIAFVAAGPGLMMMGTCAATGALIGGAIGLGVGGITTGILGGTGVLSKIN